MIHYYVIKMKAKRRCITCRKKAYKYLDYYDPDGGASVVDPYCKACLTDIAVMAKLAGDKLFDFP